MNIHMEIGDVKKLLNSSNEVVLLGDSRYVKEVIYVCDNILPPPRI